MKIESGQLLNVKNEDITNDTFSFPLIVNEISFNAFKDCSKLKNIKIPKTIDKIKFSAFQGCENLEKVQFENGLRYLSDDIFKDCKNLKSVNLPSTLTRIPKGAFDSCKSLQSIHLPNSIKYIESFAFLDCKNLKKINIPFNTRLIDNSAFSNCTSLKSIKIPSSTNEIGNFAFNNCSNLTKVKLSNDVRHISKNAFFNCTNLKYINLPSNLLSLGEYAFANCKNLTSIKIPNNIDKIKPFTFSNCISLSNIKFNNKLSTISQNAFENCTSIKSLILPESLSNINEGAFKNCTGLEELKFMPGLETISKGAFENCESIDTLILPYTIKIIGDEAFKGCKNLRQIMIPTGLTVIGNNIFENCDNLKSVYFPNTIINFGNNNNNNFKYFTKQLDGFSLSLLPEEESILMSDIKINPSILSKFWKYKNILLKEQNNKVVCNFYNKFLPVLNSSKAESIILSHNFTFLKKFDFENVKDEDAIAFYKLMYNLGGISSSEIFENKKSNYSQKVGEFFLEKTAKNEFSIDGLNNYLQTMEISGFKKEFTDFLLANYEKIISNPEIEKDFLANCYNKFEIVQKTNTSNRGSQRQLKPTVEKFIDYFKIGKFQNVTPETKKIAETIAPFTSRQESFDNAVKIETERINSKTPNNILGFHLKEEHPFENIDNMAIKINQSELNTIQNLTGIAENEFSFDWLEKNDPTNLILGKLCSCCAHLESVGYSIMHGSIVDPNIQNLVIRNKNNEIIAKSTLFINRKEGYGVFNNVEVNTSVQLYKYNQIYEKFMLGAKKFVENYNKENPNTPIKIVTIGMGNNDLEQLIREKNKKIPVILKAIDYSVYADGSNDYSGDSSVSQYIVYDENEK